MTPQELKYSILGDAFTGKLCENIISKDFGGIKVAELSDPPFDVPETWVWSTLGLCCEMYTGNSISETVKAAKYAGMKTGYDYIATKDVTFGQEICYDNGVRIPYGEGFKVAYKNAVLMCIEGGSAGRKIGILDRDVCFGNKLCSFHVHALDNKYLFYYLQSWLFKELFSGNMTGIIGGVSIKKLKEILIPVAPIAEQKGIVAKIEKLLPLIDRYEQAWSKLEDFNKRFPMDMQKSILQMAIQGKLVDQLPKEGTGEELFQQIQAEKQRLIKAGKIKKEKPLPEITEDELPFDIPENWRWVRWGDLSQSIQYGYNAPAQEKGRIKMVRISDIQDGNVLWDTVPYCDIKENEIPTYLLGANDILFARTGGTVGKSYLVKEVPEEAIYAGYLIRTQYSSLLCPEYMKYFMESQLYWDQLRNGTIATAQPNCNGKTLSKMILPLPPLAEQKRIVAKLEEILPLCERLK